MGKVIGLPCLETALRVYYEKPELANSDIRELFGTLSSSTVAKLKKPVWEEMIRRGVHTWQPQNVNTKVAYEFWGMDIAQMENSYRKLQELGLRGPIS